MRLSIPLAVFIGASVSAAFKGLQKRVDKHEEVVAKRASSKPLYTHQAPRAVDSTKFLNNKTESVYPILSFT